VPVTPGLHGQRFFVRIDGRLFATPLLVALLFLELSDIMFAVDSVPAIFALTREPLIVFTSNIFAILGLRAMYFMLAGAVDKFHLLKYGLAIVLCSSAEDGVAERLLRRQAARRRHHGQHVRLGDDAARRRRARAVRRAARARASSRRTARPPGWPSTPDGRGARPRGDHRRRRRRRAPARHGGGAHARAGARRARAEPRAQGLDSLLSIVQMPGGVPVATMAIGKAGATNAGCSPWRCSRRGAPSCASGCAPSAPSRPQRPCAGDAAVSARSCPGATIGVLGSGQLGRMFAIAARRMGYRVHVLSPDDDTPTGQVADVEVTAAYDDLDACARSPRRGRRHLRVRERPRRRRRGGRARPVRPRVPCCTRPSTGPREDVSRAAGFPCRRSRGRRFARRARRGPGGRHPAVLKTASFGYDGKGQDAWVVAGEDRRAWAASIGQPGGRAREAFVDFEREVSVVAARGLDGAFAHYGVVENRTSATSST
jgi:hypothetical protein